MGKIYFTIVMLFSVTISFAQVGVGTTTPDPSAEMDITSTNRGFLMPRVALTSTLDVTTIAGAEATSLLVYNTATAGDVTPGFYYWDGTQWVTLGGASVAAWELLGNSGTNPATNFLGTTDGQDLAIRTNNTEVVRISQPDGNSDIQLRVGNAGNNGTEQLPSYTFSNDTNTGIWSDGGDEFSLGGGGEEFLTIDETTQDELIVNEDGSDIDFRVESLSETEMFVVDAGTNHVHVRQQSPFPTIDMFTSVAPANDYPINGYATGQGNTGIYGRHATTATGTNMNAAGAFDGIGTGFSTQPGWNVGAVATGGQAGLYATSTTTSGDRQAGYFTNTGGGGGGTVQAIASVAGFTSTGNDYYGGYFDGNQSTGDYAYVGIRIGGTNYKIIGGGSVSTIVPDSNGQKRVMFASESPEITFTDSGVGQLSNGSTTIQIDPTLARNIQVDEKHPLKVFIQLEGDCNGVYVTNKSANSFTVKELANGNSNISFSWYLIANRADDYENGVLQSKNADVRFPIAPEKLKYQEAGVAKSPKDETKATPRVHEKDGE